MSGTAFIVTFRQWDAYGVWVEAATAADALAEVAADPDKFVAVARHLGEGTEDWNASPCAGGAL